MFLVAVNLGIAVRPSFFFFSSRRRHTRLQGDWSSDVCSSDLASQRGIFHSFESYIMPRSIGFLLAPKIGRASCRERSVDLGGRRIIKKKKRKIQRQPERYERTKCHRRDNKRDTSVQVRHQR